MILSFSLSLGVCVCIPNLAYSWRKVMPALAAAGYYAVAPDCRGFGRTTGWDNSFDADPLPFLALNLLRDQIALVSALGYRSTAMMVGHDQGSLMAALGALVRPDVFPRLTLIGGGFGGAPSFPFNTGLPRSTETHRPPRVCWPVSLRFQLPPR